MSEFEMTWHNFKVEPVSASLYFLSYTVRIASKKKENLLKM